VLFAACLPLCCPLAAAPQNEVAPQNAGAEPSDAGEPETPAAETPQYPLSLAIAPDGSVVVVDLNLPGLWRVPAAGGKPELIVRGSPRFRRPLNRPRCCVVLEDGAILVGDTATREIYRVAADGSGEAEPLTDGVLGVPNSLAVDSQGNLFVADLETRFVYRLPVGGGEPALYAKSIARGLHVSPAGELWAVTPTAQPLIKLPAEGKPQVVVGTRQFEFPHNVVVLEDGTAYVTDGYARAIWRVDADGQVEKWFSGEPLRNPVGLALAEESLWVADPHARQIFRISLADKAVQPLVRP
jgi:sugar lactone lactonase YvrE